MKISTLVSIVLLAFSLSAVAADGDVTSQAYEVQLKNFTAPATVNGGASFKECDDCDRRVVRVAAGTRYEVNGRGVRLEQFRKTLTQIQDRDEASLTVLHHLESDTIELIAVFY